MNQQLLQQLVSLLTQGFSQYRNPGQYEGIDRNSPVTINQALGHAYQQIAGSVGGPVGMLMQLGQKFIIPKQFNSFGNLDNKLSGKLMPFNGGTYAGAFQNFLDSSRKEALSTFTDQRQDQLKRQVYGHYFDIFHKDPSKSEQQTKKARQKFVKQTQNQMFNAPKLLNMLLDPSDIKRQIQGLQQTQAGILKWGNRRNPLDADLVDNAQNTTKFVTKMAIQASKDNASYGGFSASAITSLVGQLSSQEDILGGASDPKEVTKALQNLKTRVQGLTQALSPLRDIFGNDIPSMITRLQQISGMQVSTMTQSQVRSVASNITDMSRYSNVGISQMAKMGDLMAGAVASNGGSDWARLGARASGAYAAGLLTPGNGAFGLTPGQFQAKTLSMLASSQDSEGSQLMSMAYGLAKQAAPKMQMDQFDKRVAAGMSKGLTAIQAARQVVAQVTNTDVSKVNLYRGQSTLGNLQYRAAGRGSKWAARSLWDDQLSYALAGARQNSQFSVKQVDSVERKLRNLSAQQLTQFGNNSLNFISNNKNFSQREKKVLYSMLQRQGSRFTQAASWSGQAKKIQQYQQTQKNIREAFKDQDMDASNMYAKAVNAISGKWFNDRGQLKSQKGLKVRQSVVKTLGKSALGLSNSDTSQVHKVIKGMNALGDSDKTGDLIQYGAIGNGKTDKQYKKKLRQLANDISKAGSEDKWNQKTRSDFQQRMNQLNRMRWTGGNKTYSDLVKNREDLSPDNKKRLRRAQQQLSKIVNNDKLIPQQKRKAYQKFANRVQGIQRIRNLQNDKQLQKTQTGVLKASALTSLFLLEKGQQFTKEQFEKNKLRGSSLQYEQYQQARKKYSDGYDMKADIQANLASAINKLVQWLNKNFSK